MQFLESVLRREVVVTGCNRESLVIWFLWELSHFIIENNLYHNRKGSRISWLLFFCPDKKRRECIWLKQ